ncbi:hypothetical protein GCM10017600_56850 [Streptosporangium carneum]|uniref:Prephenate dehydrogenase nucleotide-binding domain-containing protein n=1 Tax=Streptosporangium carneum TaxID=47481 RepID=A0A9W6I6G3_9ACTN|nr:hypothetical protein GCM10017600_56850 [Streptosporangium carneum]
MSFVAGHPLAGRERSGPVAARADLFLGRPWAYCPTERTSPEAVETVLALIKLCGGEAVVADRAAAAAALREHAGTPDEGSATRPGPPPPARVADLLRRGAGGAHRVPGKHGGPARAYEVLHVLIGDRPGELARLFLAAEEAGVNIEDVRLEHAPGLPLGAAELHVRAEAVPALARILREHGWSAP